MLVVEDDGIGWNGEGDAKGTGWPARSFARWRRILEASCATSPYPLARAQALIFPRD